MKYAIFNVAHADVKSLVKAINKVLINPFIVLLFSIAFVYFLYGVVLYVINADSQDARKTGKQHMLWGIIGMVIMISVFGIMQILVNTFSLTNSHNTPVQV